MKIQRVVTAIIGMIAVWLNIVTVFSQAIIPIELVSAGEQRITDYIIGKTSNADVSFYGGSLATIPQIRNIPLSLLRERGYTHDGSFTELSRALGTVEFSAKIVPNPVKWYDIGVNIYVHDDASNVIMEGTGYANVETTNGIVVKDFSVTMYLPSEILAYTQAKSAMVVDIYGNRTEMEVTGWKAGLSLIHIPSWMLGTDRNLMVYDDGNVYSINLRTGEKFQGVQVFARLGLIKSPNIASVNEDLQLDWNFYTENGLIYGEYPLLDVVAKKPFSVGYDIIGVKVWGTDTVLHPSRIIIRSITDGKEYEVPSGKRIGVVAGYYHIFTEWNWVKDSTDNPNPGKGATENPVY